jgi:hypothetical protein
VLHGSEFKEVLIKVRVEAEGRKEARREAEGGQKEAGRRPEGAAGSQKETK